MVEMAPLTCDNCVYAKTGSYNGTDDYIKELFGNDTEVNRSIYLKIK